MNVGIRVGPGPRRVVQKMFSSFLLLLELPLKYIRDAPSVSNGLNASSLNSPDVFFVQRNNQIEACCDCVNVEQQKIKKGHRQAGAIATCHYIILVQLSYFFHPADSPLKWWRSPLRSLPLHNPLFSPFCFIFASIHHCLSVYLYPSFSLFLFYCLIVLSPLSCSFFHSTAISLHPSLFLSYSLSLCYSLTLSPISLSFKLSRSFYLPLLLFIYLSLFPFYSLSFYYSLTISNLSPFLALSLSPSILLSFSLIRYSACFVLQTRFGVDPFARQNSLPMLVIYTHYSVPNPSP